jgi:iron complex outermembrane receptor protein
MMRLRRNAVLGLRREHAKGVTMSEASRVGATKFFICFAVCLPLFAIGAESAPAETPDAMDEEALLFGEIPSVTSASRYEQPVTKAPASVSIVSADQIKKYGYRTLAAVLGSLPGFLATYDRVYNHIGVRGFSPPGDYNVRLLVLVDGHRINENLDDYSAIGRDFILDVDNIERVEVVRGPASSLYGSSAFLGVVNVITKRGRDLQGAQIAGEVSSFGTHEEQASYGKKFENGLESLFSATRYESGGHERLSFKDAYGHPRGQAENLDGERADRLFTKISYDDFTFSGGYVTRRKAVPTGTVSTIFNDPRVYYRDARAYADLNYRRTFDGVWDVTGRLFWDYYTFDDSLPYATATGSVNNKDVWGGQWFGGEFLLGRTLFGSHRLTLGSEYRRNYMQNLENYDVDPLRVYASNRVNSVVYGLFMQDEWTLRDNLRLNAGVRYDHYDTFGGAFNPRAGLIYDPFEGTTLKLLYGRAFRAPNAFESRYTCCSNTWRGNPDLKPETIETYELALEQTLGDHLRLRVSPFYYRIADIITLTATPEYNPDRDRFESIRRFRNGADKMDAAGVEAELRGQYKGYEGRFSYSFQESRNISTGAWLSNSPRHMAKLNLLAPAWGEKIYAGLEVQYLSQRLTVANRSAGGFVLANLTLFSGQLWKGLEVTGNIYNLFDTKYRDPSGPPLSPDTIQQDGRSLRLKLNYEF